MEHAREIIEQELMVGMKNAFLLLQANRQKPVEIKEFLDEYVIGQDGEAKKVLAVAVYNH